MTATQEQIRLVEERRANWQARIDRAQDQQTKGEWCSAEFFGQEFAVLLSAYDALLREREELREEVECDGGSKLARIRELEAALRENDQECSALEEMCEAKLSEAQREIESLTGEKEIVGALSVKRAEEKVVPYQHWKDLAENRLFRAEAAEARIRELEAQLKERDFFALEEAANMQSLRAQLQAERASHIRFVNQTERDERELRTLLSEADKGGSDAGQGAAEEFDEEHDSE